jgi:hypothetical protein
MISEKLAKEQILRFKAYPNDPADKAAHAERWKVLMARSRSDSHAIRAIDSLISTAHFFPTVAEIIQACEYTPDDQALAKRRLNCQICGGNGWRTVEGPYGTSAAFPCTHQEELTSAERRIGVPLDPSVQRMYHNLQEQAAERKADPAKFGTQWKPNTLSKSIQEKIR